jgi:diguanylate cyclase (GGDEF)-like protein
VPNLTTLLAMVVFTPALAGCLLLLSWLRHRRETALVVWGFGFITASIAAALIIVARGDIPNFLSIVVGNALLAVAYGILWCGARMFECKKVSVPLALVGLVVWLVACSISPIYARPEARASVMAAIGICYTLLAVAELWRGRGDGAWRWPIMALLLGHAASIPTYIPVAGAWRHPDPAEVDLLTFMIFEIAFVSICGAYLLGGLVTDQIAARFLRSSLTDPLTGVMNRRGFFDAGDRLLRCARIDREQASVLLFDLDRFKSINDRYGHGTGDEILIAFCRLATSHLRPRDFFGRIGGEEFAALLPHTRPQDALSLAERVCTAFAATPKRVEADLIRATVSVGVAVSHDSTAEVGELLKLADQALYRAKGAGRNRVEIVSAAEQVLIGRSGELVSHKAA